MPILFLLIPLVCIFIINLPKRTFGAKLAVWVVAIACLLQAVFAATYHLACWEPFANLITLPLSIELAVDSISAIVLFTIALVVAVVLTVGVRGDAKNKVVVSSVILICMAGMNGVVLVRDLFSLYVFLELMTVSVYVLIATHRNIDALAAAFKYFILGGLASLTLLLANALIFMQLGDLSFASVKGALNANDQVVIIALILYVVAFSVKAGVAPFHGWLPDAYTSASNAISVMLAGITTKVAGVYVVIRLMNEVLVNSAGEPLMGPSYAFMILGAFSIVIGAFGAFGQKEMKRMLAFSSISQIGYIILAAGLATPLALIGAMVHFFNHALFKSLLFVNSTAVEEQAGTTEFNKLGGLAERMGVTGWTSIIGFLSTAGVPPFSGFWSKLLIIIALVVSGHIFFAALAVVMSLITLAYFLLMQRRVFFGKLREGFEEIREARKPLVGTSLVLAGITTALGIVFPLVLVILQGYGLV